MRQTVLITLLTSVLLSQNLYVGAFEISTHRKLNQEATLNSSLDSYLKNNLDFRDGIEQKVKSQRVRVWIEDGGAFEDQGNFFYTNGRYRNHFHNPLKPWSQAGLNDIRSGESSLLWAQRAAGTQQFYGNHSWHDAREYFYQSLTNSNPAVRETAFANTFQAVGQVMHLVQDVSVPAHTRNDAHILPNYEHWVEDHEASLNTLPISPTVSLSVSRDGLVPITQFWDTDQYNGTVPLTGTSIGLAEYANANFLSESTIFVEAPTDRHAFPHPSRINTELWVDESNGRQYLRKTGAGEPVEHLATVSWLYWYRELYFPQYQQLLPVGLDDAVYQEQAQKLVPRAVGYSAGLLNYFFRGELDAKFDGAGFKITNKSTEAMSGTFALYYDAIDGKRYPFEGASWPLSLTPGQTSASQSLTGPLNPPPQDPGKYTLVFRGTLGMESNAVAGKIIQVPYAFIIQDEVVLDVSGPVEQDRSSYCQEIKSRIWIDYGINQDKQHTTGKFVLSGKVKRIALETYQFPKPNLHINGVLMDQATWVPGSTPTPPVAWRIDGMVTGYNITMMVEFEGGIRFEQGIYQYVFVFQQVMTDGLICTSYPAWYFNDTAVIPIAGYTDGGGILDISSLGTILTEEQFEPIQFSGHTPAENFCDLQPQRVPGDGVHPANCLSVDVYGYSRAVKDYLYEPLRYFPLTLDYFPISITGELKRIYTQREMDHLKKFGIPPQYYSITFK